MSDPSESCGLRSPMDVAQQILDLAEVMRPSGYATWRDYDIQAFGRILSEWRAEQIEYACRELREEIDRLHNLEEDDE